MFIFAVICCAWSCEGVRDSELGTYVLFCMLLNVRITRATQWFSFHISGSTDKVSVVAVTVFVVSEMNNDLILATYWTEEPKMKKYFVLWLLYRDYSEKWRGIYVELNS